MEEEKRTIYNVLSDLIGAILRASLHYSIVFIRMTVYYLVKLIYKVFKLREIDIAREREILIDNDANLEGFKHEFVFEKSERFIENWIYYKELVADLELEEEEKAELIQYVLNLIAEAERQAFNTTYDYLKTKEMREPSFQDMIIQGIFQNSSNVEAREKLDNPYMESQLDSLRHKRKYNI